MESFLLRLIADTAHANDVAKPTAASRIFTHSASYYPNKILECDAHTVFNSYILGKKVHMVFG
jgi:hypothetical protein